MAGKEGCDLVAFGEALVPGYPHWLDCTDGAKIYSNNQKKIFAHYLKNSVDISGNVIELHPQCFTLKTWWIFLVILFFFFHINALIC